MIPGRRRRPRKYVASGIHFLIFGSGSVLVSCGGDSPAIYATKRNTEISRKSRFRFAMMVSLKVGVPLRSVRTNLGECMTVEMVKYDGTRVLSDIHAVAISL